MQVKMAFILVTLSLFYQVNCGDLVCVLYIHYQVNLV